MSRVKVFAETSEVCKREQCPACGVSALSPYEWRLAYRETPEGRWMYVSCFCCGYVIGRDVCGIPDV